MDKIKRGPGEHLSMARNEGKINEIVGWINVQEPIIDALYRKVGEIKGWISAHDQNMSEARESLDKIQNSGVILNPDTEMRLTVQQLCAECNHSCQMYGGPELTECGDYDYDGSTRDKASQVAEIPIEQERTQINVEQIKHIQDERAKINRLDLTMIDFYEGGEKLDTAEAAERFELCGLNNVDFISTGAYRQPPTIEQEIEAGLHKNSSGVYGVLKGTVSAPIFMPCTYILLPEDKWKEWYGQYLDISWKQDLNGPLARKEWAYAAVKAFHDIPIYSCSGTEIKYYTD